MSDELPKIMERDEAERLLRGGSSGVDEFNSRREAGWGLRSLEGIQLSEAALISGAGSGAVNLSGARLYEACFDSAKMSNANLRGAKCDHASFKGAVLSKADLRHAELIHVQLQKADLSDAKLVKTTLGSANLSEARLPRADLSYARLGSAVFAKAILNRSRLVATNAHGTNFSSATLCESNLFRAIFRNANLTGAQLDRAVLRQTDLRQANCEMATLVGADLTNADLRGTRFRGADLRGIRGARFDSTLIRDAQLDARTSGLWDDIECAVRALSSYVHILLLGRCLFNAQRAAIRLRPSRLRRTVSVIVRRFRAVPLDPPHGDSWSNLRRTYTGSSLLFLLFPLLAYFAVLILRAAFWAGFGRAEMKLIETVCSSVRWLEAEPSGARVAQIADGVVAEIQASTSRHSVLAVILGSDRGWNLAALTVLLILYNILLYVVSRTVCGMRDAEERSGYTPQWFDRDIKSRFKRAFSGYRWCWNMHRWVMRPLFWISILAAAWRVFGWLATEVRMPV